MGSTVNQIAVLGSTGSIGQQTLDVVRALPHRFRVLGLTAGKNIGLLAKQIEEFQPRFVHYSPTEGQGGRYRLVWLILSASSNHRRILLVVPR